MTAVELAVSRKGCCWNIAVTLTDRVVSAIAFHEKAGRCQEQFCSVLALPERAVLGVYGRVPGQPRSRFSVHSESEGFQQSRWHVLVVLISPHPFLQLRRTLVFLRRNVQSLDDSLKRTRGENKRLDCFRLRKIAIHAMAPHNAPQTFLLLKYTLQPGRVGDRRYGKQKTCRSTLVQRHESARKSPAPPAAPAPGALVSEASRLFLGTCLIHVQCTFVQQSSVEGSDGFLSIFRIRHFHKSEPPRLASVVVGDNPDPIYWPESREKPTKGIFRGIETEISNVDVLQGICLWVGYLSVGWLQQGRRGSFAGPGKPESVTIKRTKSISPTHVTISAKRRLGLLEVLCKTGPRFWGMGRSLPLRAAESCEDRPLCPTVPRYNRSLFDLVPKSQYCSRRNMSPSLEQWFEHVWRNKWVHSKNIAGPRRPARCSTISLNALLVKAELIQLSRRRPDQRR